MHQPKPALNPETQPRRSRVAESIGIAFILLNLLPLHRLLARPETGLAGASTVELTDVNRDFSLAGFLFVLIGALLLGRVWPRLSPMLVRASFALRRVPERGFALGCAAFAFTAALAFNQFGLHGQPNLIDTVSQLLHARFLASGQLAAASASVSPFWHIQQTAVTPNGWLSQYPPGQVALLALGWLVGAPQLIGALMLGLVGYFSARLAIVLLPNDPLAARLGALMVASSPFLIAHAGAYMSHTTAAAFSLIAIYCAARAEYRGSALIAGGAALGLLFLTRPFTALTVGAVLAGFIGLDRRPGAAGAALRLVAGALPFALVQALYNRHFFGSPLRFGYEAALGPRAGLGWGTDPWGNAYGAIEALAYTGAEVSALSLNLLETLLPVVMVVGVYLLIAPRPSRGEWLLLAWACAPLVTHLFYWHHGLFMGPRMVNEYAPAWCLLFARALCTLYRVAPVRALAGYPVRSLVGAAALIGLGASLFLAPLRLSTFALRPARSLAAVAPVNQGIIFVHGGWEERIGMRLAAAGMRLDSVEAALRQNETCAVHQFALASAAQRAQLPGLDFEPRATDLPRRVLAGPGSPMRASTALTQSCTREAYADRFGVLDLGPLLLHAALPAHPLSRGARVIVRDLGPELNAELLANAGPHTAWLLTADARNDRVLLEPYAAGMARIWGRP